MTAAALLTNIMPIGNIANTVSSWFTISAGAVENTESNYSPARDKEYFSGNEFTFSATGDFIDYCYWYAADADFASAHADDTLDLPFTDDTTDKRGILTTDYLGLGTKASPFNGTIALAGNTNFKMSAHRALFDYVTDSAEIISDTTISTTRTPITLELERLSDVGDGEDKPLLADHVVKNSNGKKSAKWLVSVVASNYSYSGVIGEIADEASVDLKFTNNAANSIVGSSDVGAVCGKMGANSKLALEYVSENTSGHSITSTGENAGGLIGTMSDGALLTINSMSTLTNAVSVTAKNYAGGIVGDMTSKAQIVRKSNETISIAAEISGDKGAGGVFGHYINYAEKFDLADYNITAVVNGGNCGGVFGVLENKKGNLDSVALTILNTGNTGNIAVTAGNGDDDCSANYFGGVAGKYTTDDVKNSLVFDNNLTITAETKAQFKAFGGAVGIISSSAYINADNITVNATESGEKTANFGGLVGICSDGSADSKNSVFIDMGSIKLTADDFNGGGIVGKFNNGVLRLHGTADMSAAKPASGENCGQLVGYNDNVLVYALGGGNDSGWTFKRSNGAEADDLGTWGEVVRLFDSKNAEDSGIVTYDATAHTVTLAAAVTDMGTSADLAKTALNIMLNQGEDQDCLKFADKANKRSALLMSELSLSADINLSGTGINGFMRDGSTSEINASEIGDVGTFLGTLNGNSHTVTLAIGESYGSFADGQAEGTGQIYRHRYNGLFSVVGNGDTTATINSLTVSGNINVHNVGTGGINIGGVAARAHGGAVLENVTANQTANYNKSANDKENEFGVRIGGFIGYVDENNSTITANSGSNSSPKITMSGKHDDNDIYGGAIGLVDSTKFDINIEDLTVGMNADLTKADASENSRNGGLIGVISDKGSYASRKINIDKLVFDGCKVSNAATANGGGLLGYEWLNASANINGMTVKGESAVTGKAPNVGAMCYQATGKWKVRSLSVEKLDVSKVGETSLGMIVNKVYSGNDGLYLNVLNSGYELDNNISLSNAGVFDEIAAYSAEKTDKVDRVIEGGNGTGVVSIDMNTGSGAETKITETGTYQNRLKTSDDCANPNTRYYYNIDHMSTDNAGENLLLWSVNKYAADNIKAEFNSADDPFSGEADMTGLSFYPIKNAESVNIKDLTLTFDYSGIYTAENNTKNTDSYVRDPAVENQHYLMHSGLFIDQPVGNTITISGKLTLQGDFLEVGDYNGVLISGTMRGNLNVSGSIILDGIKPMTSGNSAYKEGYLLINKVERESDLKNPPSLTIKNVSTTDKYSSGGKTERVAKSLIGTAKGKGLNIVFSKIKLDARDGSSTDSALVAKAEDLYKAYGTYNSIFTDSTLLASIHTDQSAKLEYNYTKAEDWGTGTPRNVTYGKEVKDSLEYKDQEQRYYPDSDGKNDDFTNPIDNTTLSAVYDFSGGFLPYVKKSYDAAKDSNGLFYREIKVNVQSVALTSGCGTYNDPYIINDGKVLEAVASFISSGTATDLKEICLPANSADFDTLAENTGGKRWDSGDGYHADYTANDSGNYSSSADSAKDWTANNARLYLAGAYYKVTADVSLSDKFMGLGCATDKANGNYAFHGVIVGDGKSVITNASENPLIKVSNGSVVKDINIAVDSDIALTQANAGSANAYFGYNSKCDYYGGVIGEIMGGDNIIDNSYVAFGDSKVTLSGDKASLIPVGSYVGAIVYGGLIFKNMDADTANKNAEAMSVVPAGAEGDFESLTGSKQKSTIYVNPLVGRVINGYAVNETSVYSVTEDGKYHDDDGTARSGKQHSLKNGAKHYTIADINKGESGKLSVDVDGSTMTIPNSQAFFVLSLITQSMSGTAQTADGDYSNSLSYGTNTTVYGMSHNADYTDVGSATADTNSDYKLASDDTAANTAIPYIIKRYTVADSKGNYPARCVTWEQRNGFNINAPNFNNYKAVYYTIDLTADQSYTLPDSFRGIGAVGNNYSLYNMKIDKFNGNGAKIDVDIYLNRYGKSSDLDNYFDKLHSNRDQNYNNSSENYFVRNSENNRKEKAQGIGLFDRVIMQDKDSSFSSFTLSGSVNTENYDVKDISDLSTKKVEISDTFMGFDKNIDLDGKTVLISNNRPDSGYGSDNNKDWYLAPTKTKMRTDDKTQAAMFLFTKQKDGTYTISCDNKYLTVNCTLDSSPTYFTLEFKDNRYSLWSDGKHIDQNNNNGYGYWNAGGNGSYLDFTECNYKITGYDYGTEEKDVANQYISWLYTGGVCGWSDWAHYCGFDNIKLSDLTVSGATNTAGLLASSSLDSNTMQITINECSADELSVETTACFTEGGDVVYRNNVAGFVGKVDQGKVVIDGGKNGSTVKLKAVKNSSNAQRSIAAGLVGYAGNGCEASNMKVCPADSLGDNPLTIGSLKGIKMSGGIVGLMQPQTDKNNQCYANFINCEVENVNIYAENYAGGFYGGSWDSSWNPRSIKIEICKVTVNGNVSIKAKERAGGFVADGYVAKTADSGKANIEIANSIVSDYTITTTGNNSYSAGFIGYAKCHTGAIVCDIYNSSVENCVIAANGQYGGGALGFVNKNEGNKILGYNIALNNVTSKSDKMGAWVGYLDSTDTQTSIQFSGMAIYGNGFAKNIGNDVSLSNTNFVFADYTGKCNDENNANPVSDYNKSKNVDMPKAPYVNVNPHSSMGGDSVISGDGAALNGDKTMAQYIYEDIKDSNSRSYTTFDNSVVLSEKTISDYFDDSINGSRISTYKTVAGELPSGVDDFSVVVIAAKNDTETTNLLNRYIQLVTNTTTDYTAASDYYAIDIQTCGYTDGKFVIDKDAENHGLTLSGGKFSLNGGYADSNNTKYSSEKGKNVFTLVDVQFKDPLNTDNIAYHLYVPVYTIKQMEVGFSVNAETGVDSAKNNDFAAFLMS